MGFSIRGVAALLTCWTMSAGATLVSFSGTCYSGCDALSLSSGNSVSVQFQVDTGGDLANLGLSKADVTAFSVHFGDIDFGSAGFSNRDFARHTDAPGAVSSLSFIASFGVPNGVPGQSVDLRTGNWFAAPEAVCHDGTAPQYCDFSKGQGPICIGVRRRAEARRRWW